MKETTKVELNKWPEIEIPITTVFSSNNLYQYFCLPPPLSFQGGQEK